MARPNNWQNFFRVLRDYAAENADVTKAEAKELANHYTDLFEDLYDKLDDGTLSQDEFTDEWYEVYDDLLDSYDIDLHDPDFYPKKSS